MNLTTKAAFVTILTVALIAAYAAATVQVDTPTGPLFIGVAYFIHWEIVGSEPTVLGIIDIRRPDNNNITLIDDKANLTYHNKSWVVNVVAGTYYFEINDGSSTATSATFQVIDRSDNSTSPTTGGSTGTAAATTGGSTGTGSTAATTAPSKSGASTLRSNLIGLFTGLGVVALVMIQLF